MTKDIVLPIVVIPEWSCVATRQILKTEFYLVLLIQRFREGNGKLKDVFIVSAIQLLHESTWRVEVATPGIKGDPYVDVLLIADIHHTHGPMNGRGRHAAVLQEDHHILQSGSDVWCGQLKV